MVFETPFYNPEFRIIEGSLNLGEIGVKELQKFAQEVMSHARASLEEVCEIASSIDNQALVQELADLESKTLDTGVVPVSWYWSDNQHNIWNVPPMAEGIELDESFTITAFNVKSGKMLCHCLGPWNTEVETEDDSFKYQVDFIADYNLPEQKLKMLWSTGAGSTHDKLQSLKDEFLGS